MLSTRLDTAGQNPSTGPLVIPGTGGQILWCATCRDRGDAESATSSAVRETDTVYMRGLRESIMLTTSTASAWRWRRICFTIKGLPFGTNIALETSNGWTRMLWNLAGSPGRVATITDVIFRGQQGQDWSDFFTAKPDTNRIKVYSDTVRTLNSGNQQGRFFKHKRWYPMNENLVYNNDERGEDENLDAYSTFGRGGMGDYYIMDFIDCATFNASDLLNMSAEATLYWHEK